MITTMLAFALSTASATPWTNGINNPESASRTRICRAYVEAARHYDGQIDEEVRTLQNLNGQTSPASNVDHMIEQLNEEIAALEAVLEDFSAPGGLMQAELIEQVISDKLEQIAELEAWLASIPGEIAAAEERLAEALEGLDAARAELVTCRRR